ncbi:hypothetical protein GCM10009602_29630 [Nocardiopsis tropica]
MTAAIGAKKGSWPWTRPPATVHATTAATTAWTTDQKWTVTRSRAPSVATASRRQPTRSGEGVLLTAASGAGGRRGRGIRGRSAAGAGPGGTEVEHGDAFLSWTPWARTGTASMLRREGPPRERTHRTGAGMAQSLPSAYRGGPRGRREGDGKGGRGGACGPAPSFYPTNHHPLMIPIIKGLWTGATTASPTACRPQ